MLKFIVVITFAAGIQVNGDVPYGRVFEKSAIHECDASKFKHNELSYSVPDTEAIGWYGRVKSIDLIGCWAFYRAKSFNDLYLLSCSVAEICEGWVALDEPLSIRYIGSTANHTDESITFFDQTYLGGNLEVQLGNAENISLKSVQSLVIVGESGWSLYSEEHFQGNVTCVLTDDYYYYAANDLQTDLDPPLGHGIRSVKRGCDSDTTVIRASAIGGISIDVYRQLRLKKNGEVVQVVADNTQVESLGNLFD